ncbi:probable amino-acid acetyltransferase NAGS2, chloroplastic [Impatiens glandulifera]|uniref:probable amino-acid acetyltransferase NAGS2, chloroplastic n=1 Tax=Impatiens glandulifera TaxID=253017 RepID=UPI001FB09106|nr:probable amino-acid acetyltransferase NAGS2, chloroplastic [Impatiens glandulifera]
MIETKLSPGPSLTHVRRHGSNRNHVGVPVATGNFVAAKRRGVVDGIDHGATGEVKKIDVIKILKELDKGQIVMLNNFGYSTSSEALNCNSYEIATACAIALGAEKLICIIDGPIVDECGHLIRFLSLDEADSLILKRANQIEIAFKNGVGFNNGNGFWCSSSKEHGFEIGLAAAAYVCRGGVNRVHLLDGTISGVLLLELLQRDGAGTMVASDLYEGTRVARVSDIDGIKQIIQPLEESDELVRKSEEQMVKEVESFIVVEREGQVIACAALFPFFKDKCGELTAIAVSPQCRGQGQGDKLIDYIEKKASSLGLEMIFLLTTRGTDW